MTHPEREIVADESIVRSLLAAECPGFARQPIRLVDEGWDNYVFVVGDTHAVRLPRRRLAVGPLENEQTWLPVLAPRLSVAVPAPAHVGAPSDLFPWPWSVVPWIPGETADGGTFDAANTVTLAETLIALHQPSPDAAPTNPYRGVPLATRTDAFADRLDRLRGRPGIDAERLAGIWGDACAVPGAGERVWLHGDLHPRNVLVRDGSLTGIIDWGDLCGGDPATDLACAWTLIDSPPLRRELLAARGADPALAMRAMAWAAYMGLALADSGEPRHVRIGLATLARIAADS